jgi:hypothetical protein
MRRRAVVHVDTVAETVLGIAAKHWNGFAPFNLAGHHVLLADALRFFVSEIGRGAVAIRSAPEEVAAIDIGGLPVSEKRLAAHLGSLPQRDLNTTLRAAIQAFQ